MRHLFLLKLFNFFFGNELLCRNGFWKKDKFMFVARKKFQIFIGRVISVILRLGNFIVKPWQHLVAKVMIEARTSTLLPY